MVDVAGVDARGLQRVALQVQRLGAICFRDAGVADQSMCRKRPFGTEGRERRPASAAVCRIPCLILCLADVERGAYAAPCDYFPVLRLLANSDIR